jgi:hypothetical protein
MTGQLQALPLMPLGRQDPPVLGDVVVIGRLDETTSGVVYAGLVGQHRVAVALLAAGAETDSFARARFVDAVTQARADGDVVAFEDDPEVAPWVALRARSWEHGIGAARAVLAPVTLEHLPPLGRICGPRFGPHWFRGPHRGRWRVWPLPWPTSLTSAGRWTYLAAFALILAIATVALFIAVNLFKNQPPAPSPGPGPGPIGPTPPAASPRPSPTPAPTTRPGGPRPTGPVITVPVVPPQV